MTNYSDEIERKLEAINQRVEAVGDPAGFHVITNKMGCGLPTALGDEVQVYFVVSRGVVDKKCFDDLEQAEKRSRYFKYQCGGLGKTDVAKSSFRRWKVISGYDEAKNIKLAHPKFSEMRSTSMEERKELFRKRRELRKRELAEEERAKIATPLSKRQVHNDKTVDPRSVPSKTHKRLYIVECEHKGVFHLVKIGISAAPQKRLSIMQTGCPFKLKLFCETEINSNTAALEKFLHSKMKKHCERGEWFKLNRVHLKKVEQLLRDPRLFESDHKKWNKIWEDYDVLSDRNYLFHTEEMLYGSRKYSA
jgi:hypothetical protein